jgi:hypothetical protein
MRLGSSILMAPERRSMPQFAWSTSTPQYDVVEIDGSTISISDIASIGKGLMSSLRSVMHANIIRGFDLSATREQLKSSRAVFNDNFVNITPGYSFLEDDRNPWKSLRMELVKYLLHTCTPTIVRCSSGDKIQLNMDTVVQWC